MFDVGVGNYLAGRKNFEAKGEAFGKAFEHFLIQEVRAYLSYSFNDLPMTYWRTLNVQYEVDCIVGKEIAIEIKSANVFSDRMLTGLRALKEEKKIKRYFIVTRDPVPRTLDGIEIVHWEWFLERLWSHKLF